MEAMGISKDNISKPIDNREVMRKSIMGNLAAKEHESRTRSDQNAINRGVGAYKSGGQQATLTRIGRDYDQLETDADMAIEQDFANRTQRYDEMQRAFDIAALNAAMGNTNAINNYNQMASQYEWQNQANPWMARQSVLESSMMLPLLLL
jgi:plasmid maintenance system antidote protein VapI